MDETVNALVVIGVSFVMGGSSSQIAANGWARKTFVSDGKQAKIGVKSMALAWAFVTATSLLSFVTCAANITRSYKKHNRNVNCAKEKFNFSIHGLKQALFLVTSVF